MSKHTPGPMPLKTAIETLERWRRDYPYYAGSAPDLCRAIESVIAAAPEMLEALKEFMRVMDDPRTTVAMPTTYRLAKAAIRKAEEGA